VRRELLLRVATGIRALLLGGAAAAVHGPVVVVIALAAASSMLASTYRPLLIAIMPWLVRSPAELSAVNVLATTMENSGALAGPVAVAALLAAGSTWLAVGVASGFLAVATLLLWPVRLYQQHTDPGHARGSLLAGTVRGLAEMARVAPPAGIAVLRQRRRHPHRRRPSCAFLTAKVVFLKEHGSVAWSGSARSELADLGLLSALTPDAERREYSAIGAELPQAGRSLR
jgi:predicted permease